MNDVLHVKEMVNCPRLKYPVTLHSCDRCYQYYRGYQYNSGMNDGVVLCGYNEAMLEKRGPIDKTQRPNPRAA